MKIYTRGGDKGETSLFSGERLGKDDARIEALGTLDELVAVLGLAKAEVAEGTTAQQIEQLQTELYLVMADVASTDTRESRLPADAVQRMEAEIDAMQSQLPPLKDFVIPGESKASAALHNARTVCRRAERRVIAARQDGPASEAIMACLNRLADLLFVMARWIDRDDKAAGRTFKGKL